MTVFAAFALAGAVTFLLRASVMLAGGLSDTSPFARSIGFVAPAVLAAIVASAVFVERSALRRPSVAELIALVAALVAVRRSGNVGMALLVGLPMFWAASALFG